MLTVSFAGGVTANETGFTDLNKRHWAYEEITGAVSKGYVSGYPDQTFGANLTITRAEFIKMIVEALKLPHSSGGSPWYRSYIAAATDFGLIQSGDSTAYNGSIKRIEMIRLIGRVLAIEGSYHSLIPDLSLLRKFDLPFVDTDQFQNKDAALIALIYGTGILNGYTDGRLEVNDKLTRAEAVVVLEKTLKVRKVSPDKFDKLQVLLESIRGSV